MRIKRSRLPDPRSPARAVLGQLADPWYAKGLTRRFLDELCAIQPREVGDGIAECLDRELIEYRGGAYHLTDRAKELLDG